MAKVHIEITASNLEIVPGDTFVHNADSLKEAKFSIAQKKNGDISIRELKREKRRFHFFHRIKKHDTLQKLKVNLPKDVEVIEISSQLGNISVHDFNDLKRLICKNDAGSIKISDSKALSYGIQTNVGTIKLKRLHAELISAKAEVGNMKLHACESSDISLKTEAGSIEVEESLILQDATVETKTGNIHIHKSIEPYDKVKTRISVGKIQDTRDVKHIVDDKRGANWLVATDVGAIHLDD